MLRRHRVIESLSGQALGYAWDEVHEEAERLEHAASPELVNRMAAAIGEPAVDPHGAPIPTARHAGGAPRSARWAISPSADRAQIARVEDEDPALLRYLASLRFLPAPRCRCSSGSPSRDRLTIRVGQKTHVIGPALAARVFVSAP